MAGEKMTVDIKPKAKLQKFDKDGNLYETITTDEKGNKIVKTEKKDKQEE